MIKLLFVKDLFDRRDDNDDDVDVDEDNEHDADNNDHGDDDDHGDLYDLYSIVDDWLQYRNKCQHRDDFPNDDA